jgi:DNA-binding protein Fis
MSARRKDWVLAITAALRVNGGNMVAAAAMLGVSSGAIRARLARAPSLWPVGLAKRGRGRPRLAEDGAVTAALTLSGGNQRLAAELLGVERTTICARLAARPEVWPAGVARLAPGRPAGGAP